MGEMPNSTPKDAGNQPKLEEIYSKRTLSDLDTTKIRLRDVMDRLLDEHHGGEGIEALRVIAAKEPSIFFRVNAYWAYSLYTWKGRPFPMVPMLIYLMYCCGVISFMLYAVPNSADDDLKAKKPEMKDIASLFALVLFLLMAFRNNSSYQRWYEAAQQFYRLTGLFMSASRQVSAVHPPKNGVKVLWWLFAGLYSAKQQLRVQPGKEPDYELLELALPPEMWSELANRPDKFQWCLYRYEHLTAHQDVPGKTATKACEEIYKCAHQIALVYADLYRLLCTPMPAAYLFHLRSLMSLWLALLPWVFVASYGFWSLIFCAMLAYGVLGTEESAVEVEMPLGGDCNDLPLDYIAREAFGHMFYYIAHVGFDDDGRAVVRTFEFEEVPHRIKVPA